MILQIEPWIDESELEQLKKVVDSTFVTEASLTDEFESKIKELTGSKYAIAMTNGTVALFCALKSLGIGVGDEVLVPDMTFVATSNAVVLAGATPVFCDVEPETLSIDLEDAQKRITNKTKAIVPVHLYGQAVNMDDLMSFAKLHGLLVVEDAAQGVGVKFNGKHTGTFGDAGVLSFYGNKTITCGEGGVLLTSNEVVAKACYRLKNHGRDGKGTFIHEHIGFNFGFTEMQAAIGISQLGKLNQIIAKKRQIHDVYGQELSGIDNFCIAETKSYTTPVFWFTSFFTSKVEELQKFLIENGIQTRRFFYPLHLQPCYKKADYINTDYACPFSLRAYNTGISLPSAYNLTEGDQQKVIDAVKRFFL